MIIAMQQPIDSAPPAGGVGRILAAGADADAFLQGQLTQDLRRLHGDPLLAGYCSPKGRLLAVMQLQRAPQGVILELHRGVLDATLRRLKMFVLRSRVTLEALDPAVPQSADESWRKLQIARGVPTVFPATGDHFVPQTCNLDVLGGISFDKGCYTGQEIVARLHYLGQVKRRMFRARCAAPAAPGSPVFDARGDAQAVGEIVDWVDGDALAVLQLAHAGGDLRLGALDGPQLSQPVDLAGAGG